MILKLDLHTHSIASPDGGLTMRDYKQALKNKQLDYIAITDHNTIAFALLANRTLGDRIIIGEEIMTTEGEIIGLYLQRPVAAGLSPKDTIAAIRQQNGIVYIPHPFETLRSGLQLSTMERIKDHIDIVETFNGRALSKKVTQQAAAWARERGKSVAASSDAHGRLGWRKTYTLIDDEPSRANLKASLTKPVLVQKGVGLSGLLYPKVNRYIMKGQRNNV
ncbi:MAG: PHP domain-containing protein [Candidatus Saccharimonadales bacterium]